MLRNIAITAAAVASLSVMALAQTATQPASPPASAPAQPAAPAASAPAAAAPAAGTPATGTAGAAATQGAQPAGGATNWGIRTVDPATLRLTFYTVRPADMLVSNLLEMDVYNLQNEEVGEIEDLIVDNGKTIRAVIVSVGGFLGIGERRVAIDPAAIAITRTEGGEMRAVVNSTRDDLKNAPEFRFEGPMARN